MFRLFKLVLLVAIISVSSNLIAQSNADCASVNIYRLKESAMSGGRGLSVKVFINDKEISQLQSNTKMNYKIYSVGSVKIKCTAEFGGGSIGSPYVLPIELEKGKEYHINIKAGSMFGVKGEVMNDKKMKKINKNKFADTISLEEEK